MTYWFSEWFRFEDVEIVNSPQPLIIEESPAEGSRSKRPMLSLAPVKAVLFLGEPKPYIPSDDVLDAWLEVVNKDGETLIEFIREFGPLGLYYFNLNDLIDFERDKNGLRVDIIRTKETAMMPGSMSSPEYWRMFHRGSSKPRRLQVTPDRVFSNYLEPGPLLIEQIKAFRCRLSLQNVLEPVVTKPFLRGTRGRLRIGYMYRSLLDELYIKTSLSFVSGSTIEECKKCGGLFLKRMPRMVYCSDECKKQSKAEYIREHQQSESQKWKMILRSRLAARRRTDDISAEDEARIRDCINNARSIEEAEESCPILKPRKQGGKSGVHKT
jgi:hypothetical protein